MREFLESVIKTGNYNLADMENRIVKLFAMGNISEEDMADLLAIAANDASDSGQVDLMAKIVDLEHRIVALETADIVVWVSGYSTKNGEVVKYDYKGDGEYDLLRYDGGRSYTTLSPGKIDGWHVVDSTGKILGTWYQNQFTPVEEEVTTEA